MNKNMKFPEVGKCIWSSAETCHHQKDDEEPCKGLDTTCNFHFDRSDFDSD